MIFNSLRKATLLSVLFLATVVFVSCEKFEDSAVGNEIQPEDDLIGLNRVDTFFISTKTIAADSSSIDELSANLVGSISDPFFGTLNCGTFAHLRLTSENIDLGTDPMTVDSVVLGLGYSAYYGDTTTELQFNVEESATTISRDSLYYTTKTIGTTGESLVETPGLSYKINPTSPVTLADDTVNAHLRIRLKTDFGNRILNAGTGVLKNSATFIDYFKGIYVTSNTVTTPSKGVIAYFNPLSELSKVTIYYHSTTEDSLRFNLPITSSSARLTTFSRNYTGTPVEQQLNGTTTGEQEVYLQAGGGLKVELKLPTLLNLNDSNGVVINKAELVLPVVAGTETPLKPNNRLLLQVIKEDGGNEVPIDIFISYFNGYYNSTDNAYHFIINRYVQQLFNGSKSNYGLRVLTDNAGGTANRTILAGSNNVAGKPKLILTYTKP